MSPKPSGRIERVLICGGGLAAQMAVAALSRQLPPALSLTWVRTAAPDSDLFYGNITPPSAYDFNLLVGVTEPDVVLNSNTAFSYGTGFVLWNGRSWVQGFQQPLPILDGVLLHQYLPPHKIPTLEPFLVTALAAREGRFAHPPETGVNPLAKAEYGYHFDLTAYGALFLAAIDTGRVTIIDAEVASVEQSDKQLTALKLSDGQVVTADLYIDATGSQARLLSALPGQFSGERRLKALASFAPAPQIGPPARLLWSHDFGWLADTALQDGMARMTVCAPEDEAAALAAHGGTPDTSAEGVIGRQDQAWRGNCVAIGHAAALIEPLTPAPVMLLQKDIARLLSLLPHGADMSVERDAFNRGFEDNYDNAALFTRAFFEISGLPDTAYWQEARKDPVSPLLLRKIEQFESRGLHVGYDNEPFHQEDWIILHYGMGRLPSRYDRMVDRAPMANVRNYLITTQSSIDNTVKSMPSHDSYMKGLRKYLTQQGEV